MSMIQEALEKIHIKQQMKAEWLNFFLFFLLALFILSGVSIVPFHGDEATFIWLSRDYDTVIRRGLVKDIMFEPDGDAKDGQNTRMTTGSIFPFSVGLLCDIVNMNNDAVVNRWDWVYPPDEGDRMWSENIRNGNLPNTTLLLLARFVSAFAGALSLVFIFLSARRLLSSQLSAWMAVLLLATHGDFLVNVRRAMQEGVKFLFLSIVLYVASVMLTEISQHRRVYVWLGVASGLTLAAKQDAAPVLVAIYIVLVLIPLWKRETQYVILLNILYIFASTLVAFAVFYALMPVLWHWFLNVPVLIGIALLLFHIPSMQNKRIALIGITVLLAITIWMGAYQPLGALVHERQRTLNGQVGYRIKYDLFYLDTPKKRALFTLKSLFRSSVMYMESPRFDIGPINEQIATYEASLVHGRINSLALDTITAILFFTGIWTLLKHFGIRSLLFFSLLLIPTIILCITVPLAFQRYFLILQIPYSLIAGAGVGQAWEWGKTLTEQSIRQKS
ncbi:MAG: phospholipid carrier-dependent glycosyltransferase [Anaerolineales bacterium]|nr:phospholipid carrier-dependent glycosyltransferase [Anaerolineales bacterium]